MKVAVDDKNAQQRRGCDCFGKRSAHSFPSIRPVHPLLPAAIQRRSSVQPQTVTFSLAIGHIEAVGTCNEYSRLLSITNSPDTIEKNMIASLSRADHRPSLPRPHHYPFTSQIGDMLLTALKGMYVVIDSTVNPRVLNVNSR